MLTSIFGGEFFCWKFNEIGGIHIFPDDKDSNATRLIVLGEDVYNTFSILRDNSKFSSGQRIPQVECSRPDSSDLYLICYSDNKCQRWTILFVLIFI